MKFHDIWKGICEYHGLDQDRFKVEFEYETYEDANKRVSDALGRGEFAHGRFSACRIYDNGQIAAADGAWCSPNDQFVKAEGRREAFKRAWKQFKGQYGLSRKTVSR